VQGGKTMKNYKFEMIEKYKIKIKAKTRKEAIYELLHDEEGKHKGEWASSGWLIFNDTTGEYEKVRE